ncbi:hypothetical protein D9M71_757350 [compost metagenome]
MQAGFADHFFFVEPAVGGAQQHAPALVVAELAGDAFVDVGVEQAAQVAGGEPGFVADEEGAQLAAVAAEDLRGDFGKGHGESSIHWGWGAATASIVGGGPCECGSTGRIN